MRDSATAKPQSCLGQLGRMRRDTVTRMSYTKCIAHGRGRGDGILLPMLHCVFACAIKFHDSCETRQLIGLLTCLHEIFAFCTRQAWLKGLRGQLQGDPGLGVGA